MWLERRRQNADGLSRSVMNGLATGSVVKRGLREVGNLDEERFSETGFRLGRVNGEENSFEARQGREGRRIRGVDTGKVDTGKEREEREDEEAQMRVGGLESFVEPLAKRIRTGSRGRRGKGRGN